MEAPAVKLQDVNVWYGSNQVLFDINLEIPRRVVYTIMGPSGCGKSTLLRTINKLILLREGARVSGRVEVLGHDIYNSQSHEIPSRLTGTVFQMPNPFPHLSIFDNVALGPKLHGLARGRELDELVRWALEKASLWEEVKNRLREPAFRLSGGQQQRLCIARALAMEPKILLMDEPTANLDPLNASRIEDVIRELGKEMTVVIVTHDPSQAERVAGRGAVLFMGRVIQEGPVDSLFATSYHELISRLTLEANAKSVPERFSAAGFI